MQKAIRWRSLLVVSLILMFLIVGCQSTQRYYSKEDFEDIVIGKSTYDDVYQIAPSDSLYAASYGWFCEYPMENGGRIHIEFDWENEIVIAIEELP